VKIKPQKKINRSHRDGKPNGYRLEDDDNLEEKDLKRTFLFGDAEMKSTNDPGMGAQNFGKNNVTPAGNDQGNCIILPLRPLKNSH